jgi:hypothetical protein
MAFVEISSGSIHCRLDDPSDAAVFDFLLQ